MTRGRRLATSGPRRSYLENARNLPYFVMRGALDEFETTGTYQQTLGIPGWPGLTSFRERGYRFQLRNYLTADHFRARPGAAARPRRR